MTDPQLLDRLRELWNRQPEPTTEPEPLDMPVETLKIRPEPPPWCPTYRHRRSWRSIYGPHIICATCHPPVSDSVVAEWIDEPKRPILDTLQASGIMLT